jgi:hypothetical protein
MTHIDFISLWQSEAPDIKTEALKGHIHADLAMRRRFRAAILTAQIIPVIIAAVMDIYGLFTWRWLATAVTLGALIVQLYKMHHSRKNRHLPIDLTPREALIAALRQNKINIRNAWIFSDVIPVSGLMGGLIGALFSRFIITPNSWANSGSAQGMNLMLMFFIAMILAATALGHVIGKRIGRIKKAERAILRKRLTLLDAGVVMRR